MTRNKSHAISLKIGRSAKLYRKESGLLQGDPLSSALCDVYLGDLVQVKRRTVLVQAQRHLGFERVYI